MDLIDSDASSSEEQNDVDDQIQEKRNKEIVVPKLHGRERKPSPEPPQQSEESEDDGKPMTVVISDDSTHNHFKRSYK